MVLGPLVVAHLQPLTAIDLFFNDRGPISVHVLASNAREILQSLCRLAAVEPVTELVLRDHANKPKKDIYATLNLYRNCFNQVGKTWEERKEEQATLNQFDDSKNEYLLYVCVEDYVRLRSSCPFPMQAFHAWFCAIHSDFLDPVYLYPRQKFRDLSSTIAQMDRYQQKRVALGIIKRSSDDPEVRSSADGAHAC